MLTDKKQLETCLEKYSFDIVVDKQKSKELCDYAYSTYNIPKSLVLDYFTHRKSFVEASEFELFILLDSVIKFIDKTNKLSVYFTDKEINFYEKEKYRTEKLEFPLEFKAIQIANDQWIGRIDVKTMMKFRKAQLINYNENTQRTMTRIVQGKNIGYKPTLNEKAVVEIAKKCENNTFIPNTITLNISDESDADFYYDEGTCTFVVNKINHFDMIDGYHRYVGQARVFDKIKDFNYPMELRITNFSEIKAKNFIYQEDQKTKMRKSDSKSMDMNNIANITVERLNSNVNFNLSGSISRNKGLIDFGDFAILVGRFYFKDIPKERQRITMLETVKELTAKINSFTEYYPEYLEKEMDYSEILSMIICFKYFEKSDDCNINEIVERTANKIRNNPYLRIKQLTKKRIKMIEDLIKESVDEMEGK